MKGESGFTREQLQRLVITIYGLGQIGGSLALALRQAGLGQKLQGIDQDENTLKRALAQGVIDNGSIRAADVLINSDLVILALPVGALCNVLDSLGPLLKPAAVVTDVGSTKVIVTQRMNNLPAGIKAIGGHPMCGGELSGFSAARADLFKGATFVLTPNRKTDLFTLKMLKYLVTVLGANPIILDAKTHDELVTRTSHLPYLIATALFSMVHATGVVDDRLVALMASGFGDTTRIAGSDVEMMLDIIRTNRHNILSQLEHFRSTLAEIIQYVQSENDAELETFLTAQMENRRRLQTRFS